jgi:alpha/beta superfamily hydrolase
MTATSDVQGQMGRLETRLTVPPTAKVGQVAVVCHPHPLFGGTMDNKVVTTIVRAYKEKGLPVVTFNFRGVGQSEGKHDNGVGEVDDVIAVITWALAQTQATELYLAGFSFGSFIAAAAVSRLSALPIQLKQLVLIAPPVHHYPFAAFDLPTATLIIQGDADEVVPADEVFDWADQKALKVVRFEGCSHFFHGRLPELRQSILENHV